MRKEEKASISIMKIICVSIILILISGIGVMAVNTKLNDIKITLQNGYEMTVLTSKTKVVLAHTPSKSAKLGKFVFFVQE